MKRIMVPTVTQPGVPNVNGLVYDYPVWHDFIRNSTNGGYTKIPVTIGQCIVHNTQGCIPFEQIIGYVSIISDKYVIVDFIDYEKRFEDHPLAIAFIDCLVDRIHKGDIKAYMNYICDIDIEPSMACRYVSKIYNIINFYPYHADPRGYSPLEFSTEELGVYVEKRNRKRKGRK